MTSTTNTFVICDDPNAVNLGFEGFASGTVISDQYEGITIEAQRDRRNTEENDAMIFDSNNVTGGDTDLATSTQGNILIVSEDNDSSDADDAIGGSITFTFDNPTSIHDIKVIDTEEGGTITLKDADGNVLGTFDIPRIGDGDIDQVLMNVEGVSSMTVELNGSGAIDDLCYIPEAQTGSISGTVFCDTDCDGVQDLGQDVSLGDNLIINGDFENHSLGSKKWGLFDSIEGWTAVENKIEIQQGAVSGTTTAAGNSVVELAGSANSTIAQTVNIQEAGSYQFSMDYAMRGNNADTNGFAIYVDGVLVESIQPSSQQFETLTITLDLDVGSSQIEIKGTGTSDGIGSIVDNIALQQVIEAVPAEDVKEGITVKLLNTDGSSVLDADGNPITTLTDVEGNYSFDDVPVGDYTVMFVNPDGTEFTLQDIGNDDTIDSDANENGMTGVISVAAGEDVTDVDAGLKEIEQGSISGRYFCDTDGDAQDNNNGDEPAVAGAKVWLVLNGEGVIASTTTDANGNYSFEGLDAGDYSVRFEDPADVASVDGDKEFVQSNVGDDSQDSDTTIVGGAGNGNTDFFSLAAGENKTDIDAGIVDNTITAEDDSAETCYDEAVSVDVIANDSDPQNQSLTVTAINGQAITEGGEAVNIDGVLVTLVDGELYFDGSNAHVDLVGGESETTSFTYTVSDGNNVAEANVDVTFKGATDTIEKVQAELPTTATVQIIQESEDVGNGTSDDAFTIQFSDAGDLNGVFENAYCVDFFDPIDVGGHGTSISDAPLVSANLTIATADNLTEEQAAELGAGGINGESAVDNLDLINWIINQDFENTDNGDGNATNYSDAEIQGAIWALTNGETLESFGVSGGVFVEPGFGTSDNGQEILDLAIANGEGFVAGEGDLVGVLVDPVSPDSSVQPFIVAMDLYEECVC